MEDGKVVAMISSFATTIKTKRVGGEATREKFANGTHRTTGTGGVPGIQALGQSLCSRRHPKILCPIVRNAACAPL